MHIKYESLKELNENNGYLRTKIVDKFKILNNACSVDPARQALQGVYMEVEGSEHVKLYSTDGHVAVFYQNVMYAQVIGYVKKEFGFKMPETPQEGWIVTNTKIRKQLECLVFETKDSTVIAGPYPNIRRIIPSQYESPLDNYPLIGKDIHEFIKKSFGSKFYYYPDYWNNQTGAAIKVLEYRKNGSHDFLLTMPIKAYPEQLKDFTLNLGGD